MADPAVVLVGGEAGVGKTRLIAELTARCATDGTRVLAGGCVPVGDGALPYAPIVEALRALVADVGVGAVRELVGPSWPELARLLPALGAPERAGPPGQAAQARLFELLLGLLGRLGEQAPLVLVVEDLHWADRSTRDLLAFLVRNLRRERILLVVTYRNDEPGQQRLGPYLAELDRGQPGRAHRAAPAGPGPDGGAAGRHPRSGPSRRPGGRRVRPVRGQPVLHRGAAGGRAGRLGRAAGDPARPAPWPGRRRCPSRPGRCWRWSRWPAGDVSHRLLAAVVGLDDPALVEALRAAVASQLLVTTPGEDGYQVRHALLREVDRRRPAARRTGPAARRPGPERSPSGPSWPMAHRRWRPPRWPPTGTRPASPPGPCRPGSRPGWPPSGPGPSPRPNATTSAPWSCGSRCTDPGRAAGLDQAELLTRTADAASASGRSRACAGAADQAHSTSSTRRSTRSGRRCCTCGWGASAGRPATSRAAWPPSRRRCGSCRPSRRPSGPASWPSTPSALMLAAPLRDAVGRAEEALVVARTVGARAEEGHALDILGCCTLDIGYLEEALRIAEEVGNAEGIVRAYLNLGATLGVDGRTRDALAVTRRGLAVARELGLEQAMGSFLTAQPGRHPVRPRRLGGVRPGPRRGVGARDDRCLRAAHGQGQARGGPG